MFVWTFLFLLECKANILIQFKFFTINLLVKSDHGRGKGKCDTETNKSDKIESNYRQHCLKVRKKV
jgi:hypothetical protein